MSLDSHGVPVEYGRRLVISADNDGWEVREEQHSTVVSRVHRHDWHRVEIDVLLFDRTAAALKQAGWTEL